MSLCFNLPCSEICPLNSCGEGTHLRGTEVPRQRPPLPRRPRRLRPILHQTTLPRIPARRAQPQFPVMSGDAEAEVHGCAQWPLGASVWLACAGCCSTSRACCTTAARVAVCRSPAPWRRWRGEWAAVAAAKAGQSGPCSRLWPLPGPGRGREGRGCCPGPAPET